MRASPAPAVQAASGRTGAGARSWRGRQRCCRALQRLPSRSGHPTVAALTLNLLGTVGRPHHLLPNSLPYPPLDVVVQWGRAKHEGGSQAAAREPSEQPGNGAARRHRCSARGSVGDDPAPCPVGSSSGGAKWVEGGRASRGAPKCKAWRCRSRCQPASIVCRGDQKLHATAERSQFPLKPSPCTKRGPGSHDCGPVIDPRVRHDSRIALQRCGGPQPPGVLALHSRRPCTAAKPDHLALGIHSTVIRPALMPQVPRIPCRRRCRPLPPSTLTALHNVCHCRG